MKFSLTTLLVPLVALTSTTLAAPLRRRDVFVPKLLTPAKGDVWQVGSTQKVTWDVSNPPAQITNPKGTIYLKKPNGRIDLKHPLAQGFDITSGVQEVTVPSVPTSGKYSLILMGDSGNDGPTFSIVHAVGSNDDDDFDVSKDEEDDEDDLD